LQGNDGVDVERAPHAQDAVVGPGRRSQSADGRRTGRAGGQVTAVPAGGRGRGRRERSVRAAVRHIQRGRGGRRPTPVEPVGVDAGPGRPLPAVGRGRRRRSQRHGRGRSRRRSPAAAASPPSAAATATAPPAFVPTTPGGGRGRPRI